MLYRSAKQNRTRKFHALYDKLTRFDVMQRAWSDVARNQGAPGVDKVSITDISSRGPESIQAFIDVLSEELRTGTYRPKPLRRVHIPKPGKSGETRPLGIPTVTDRIAQGVAKAYIEPRLEVIFHEDSYGVTGRSVQPTMRSRKHARGVGVMTGSLM